MLFTNLRLLLLFVIFFSQIQISVIFWCRFSHRALIAQLVATPILLTQSYFDQAFEHLSSRFFPFIHFYLNYVQAPIHCRLIGLSCAIGPIFAHPDGLDFQKYLAICRTFL
jgi:hypothetical protein